MLWINCRFSCKENVDSFLQNILYVDNVDNLSDKKIFPTKLSRSTFIDFKGFEALFNKSTAPTITKTKKN